MTDSDGWTNISSKYLFRLWKSRVNEQKRNILSRMLASSLFLDIPNSVQAQRTSVKTTVSGFPYSTSTFDARIS